MIENAHTSWMQLGRKYSSDEQYLQFVWEKVLKQHSAKNRHYHNLNHIWSMINQSNEFEKDLNDKDLIDFSIWFHDIIYKSTKKNNEEESAKFALEVLTKLSFDTDKRQKVYNFILSTKKHQVLDRTNLDNSYLLDFDLSILGKPWVVYEKYIQQIRREYKIYPDILYKPGRKKVLHSFLERETLYFTEKYQSLFEVTARENLSREIELLNL